ncbi:MAG: hypothetical protein Q9164_006188 [Protoblastenia rupestris]
MGRPRKRRRDEDLHSPAIDPWGFGYSGGEVGVTLEDYGDNVHFPDILDPQFSSNGFAQPDLLGPESTDGTTESNVLGLDYPAPSTQDLGASGLGHDGFFLDYTPNGLPDSQGWASTPTQLDTPLITTNYNHNNQDPDQIASISCGCLPDLYKLLSSFPSTTNPSFPYSIGLLKQSTNKGRAVLVCEVCPKAYNTALQNSMLLGTLMNLVISEYAKLLKHIDERSEKEDKIVFRMGEHHTPEKAHLHTGNIDCPMAISIDLSGAEWRILARKAVRKEISGDHPGDQCLASLVDGMKDRQIQWHHNLSKEAHQHGQGFKQDGNGTRTANECICTQVMYIDQLKRSLDALGL